MLVRNIGYNKIENLIDLKNKGINFSIYNTAKNTNILVKECFTESIHLFQPKYDRLPYKLIEGKYITRGNKIFDSKKQDIIEINLNGWNNKNQIMTYVEFEN